MQSNLIAGGCRSLWFMPPGASVTSWNVASAIRKLPRSLRLTWGMTLARELPIMSSDILKAIALDCPWDAGFWNVWIRLSHVIGFEDALVEWARSEGGLSDVLGAGEWVSAANSYMCTSPEAGNGTLARLLAEEIVFGSGPLVRAASDILSLASSLPTSLLLKVAPRLTSDMVYHRFLGRPEATIEVWEAWKHHDRFPGDAYCPPELAYVVSCRPDLRNLPDFRAMALAQSGSLMDIMPEMGLLLTSTPEEYAFWLEVAARGAYKQYVPDGSSNDIAEVRALNDARALLIRMSAIAPDTEKLEWLVRSDDAEVRHWAQTEYADLVRSAHSGAER